MSCRLRVNRFVWVRMESQKVANPLTKLDEEDATWNTSVGQTGAAAFAKGVGVSSGLQSVPSANVRCAKRGKPIG